ncbi:UDP-N-acetylmuramate dehydrogenase [Candidatus Kinetoplastibacterium oncopeltii TCC290E]|uniref:UDP-N-acetylenolpyruvoylglucosamine reductase n=1 Tax=Candidatus Kinetoplastidibacterium stringomonadis TCC290E TaxID=1208920 RepID=M1L7E5_9PROT|nr:UDP-N-acetylmuramate dehydrogenase [Candidatus Kinetoplastibacterium oncopeltii]AGF48518.1 UDP-N-acetylmuramate dehydrogenase [Candidatus Kinetoplastibacterium oncopeltii TCC290E]
MKSKPKHQNLKHFNTFSLDSYTDHFFVVRNFEDLKFITNIFEDYKDIFIIGGGSNVILKDYIKSLVIKVGFSGIKIISSFEDTVLVEAYAGESWHDFVMYCINKGWYGLENLAFIPGTVGAAPVQNIGAYGIEFSRCCYSVVAWNLTNGKMVELPAKECFFSYRDSIFKQKTYKNFIILSIRVILSKIWNPNIEYFKRNDYFVSRSLKCLVDINNVISIIYNTRNSKLPNIKEFGNVGSFFKNPIVSKDVLLNAIYLFSNLVFWKIGEDSYKVSAGWLIDNCGWKGKTYGKVTVYEKNALILLNQGFAKFDDVMRLATFIINDVYLKSGIRLEIEPRIY